MKAIDVSNVNGSIDWRRVARDGVQLAFVKGSEGVTYDDPNLAANLAGARKNGVLVTLYHFARPDLHKNPYYEARHFARIVNAHKPLDARWVLDFEHAAPLSRAAMAGWALSFMRYVEAHTGTRGMFYSYPSFITDTMGGAPGLQQFPLWLASYGPNDGAEHSYAAVGGWKAVAVHQFTSNGHVNGVPGRVDLDDVQTTAILLGPKPKPTPAPEPGTPLSKLRAKTGYWSWLAWRLGEGAWKGRKPQAPGARPAVPKRIPRGWWKRATAFLRARGQ